ncbi:MAG TPA: amidohydrolase family protein [Candidatus Saccharimonadales bacterium]|nr:amidohydrolase family protein [Candidatus Saccharimonadales bacterium]
MPRTLVETQAVLTFDPARAFVPGGALLVEDGRIAAVLAPGERRAGAPGATVVALGDCLALPGFVQTHLHLCQTLFRGLAEELDLLDWLSRRIFPLEAAHDEASMRAAVRLGLLELVRSGTTALMDMGTLRHTEVIGQELEASGLRAFFGKTLMDLPGSCPELHEPAPAALAEARELAGRFHGRAGGRLRYAFTPRFVLSCSDGLMRDSFALAGAYEHSRWHTHASESTREQQAVHQRCGCGNVEHLDRLGTLSALSCLAHCVHLSEAEEGILARTGAHVLHCPGSNLKLASGIADVPGLRARGVSVSLGCDGAACNNTLDMFSEMRLAALIQKPRHGPAALPPLAVLEMATRGGARALGWEAETGSLEPGKAADVVFLDLHRGWNPTAPATAEEYAAAVVYTGRPENVRAVLSHGEWLVRDGRALRWDEVEARARAREALGALRTRAKL